MRYRQPQNQCQYDLSPWTHKMTITNMFLIEMLVTKFDTFQQIFTLSQLSTRQKAVYLEDNYKLNNSECYDGLMILSFYQNIKGRYDTIFKHSNVNELSNNAIKSA